MKSTQHNTRNQKKLKQKKTSSRQLHTKSISRSKHLTLSKNLKKTPHTTATQHFSSNISKLPYEERLPVITKFDTHAKEMEKYIDTFDTPEEGWEAIQKKISSFPTRQWTVEDSLAILPYWLTNLVPESSQMANGKHRLSNLRAKLMNDEEEYKNKRLKEVGPAQANAENDLSKEWHAINTIKHIPVPDIVRLMIQLQLHTLGSVVSQYEWSTQTSFNKYQNLNTIYSAILSHLEVVPSLIYYRIRYNQLIPHTVSYLCDLDYKKEVLPEMEKLTPLLYQRIAKKRLMYSKSPQFREELKKTFQKMNILTDTSRLPPSDPINAYKEQVIRDLSMDEFCSISQKLGLQLPIGHLFVELELALGCVLPFEAKRELHIRTLHNMLKIAKMPIKPVVKEEYRKYISNVPIPSQYISKFYSDSKTTIESLSTAKLDDDDNVDNDGSSSSVRKLSYNADGQKQEKNPEDLLTGGFNPEDNIDFIDELEITNPPLPEELWLTPMSRMLRQNFFHTYPEMKSMFVAFDAITAYTYQSRGLLYEKKKCENNIERYRQAKKELLLPTQGNLDNTTVSPNLVGSLKDLQTTLDLQINRLDELEKEIEKVNDNLANVRTEYQSYARIAKQQYPHYFDNLESPL